ncbi:MAG: recombinase [Psychroflexus sp.]
MIFQKKTEKQTNIYRFFKTYFEDESWKNVSAQEDILAKFIEIFRPEKIDDETTVSFQPLISLLKENNNYRTHFAAYLSELLSEKKFHFLVADAGIPEVSDFFYEAKEKIFSKILPKQPEDDTLEYIFNQVFYKSDDPEWIATIDKGEFRILFTLLEFKPLNCSVEIGSALSQLLYGFEIITLRICGKAMENNIIRMVPEYDNLESPFVAFQNDLTLVEKHILNSDQYYLKPDNEDFKQLFVLLGQCKDLINQAFKNSKKFGISLRVNQDLLRIQRQLLRLEVMLPFLSGEDENDFRENSINLALRLVKNHCGRNNLSKFVSEGTRLISYEITQHTAKTGEHYITSSRSGYLNMFKTSIGGGLVVGIMCVIKVLLYKLELSDFGAAFLYSMNYAIGFVILYLLGFTLATKQPAMTASTLMNALEKGMQSGGGKRRKHQAFAKLFSEVFRSQFIAFAGNVIMAFPVAMLVVYLVDLGFGYNIPESKWAKLISNLNPATSLAIFHAGIAGIFLFLSGLIAGGISNRNKFNNIYKRIGKHPFLKRKFGKKKTAKFAQFIEKKWAGIMSNFWFGVFMGTTASVGVFLGLNLDIRHIAFSSGNFALGVYGSGFETTTAMILWSILGIIIIGLMNFSVSFGLSMLLAFRSRRIPVSEFKSIFSSVIAYFIQRPFVFFLPPKNQDTDNIETDKEE